MPDESATLETGESRGPIEIRARPMWNSTGIRLVPGARYRFAAEGTWNDGGIDAGPEGFRIIDAPRISRWLLRTCEPLLRERGSRYFCLIGCIEGDTEHCFPIGSGLADWSAPTTAGVLRCFANDVPFAYWNNSGHIRLTVTRLG